MGSSLIVVDEDGTIVGATDAFRIHFMLYHKKPVNPKLHGWADPIGVWWYEDAMWQTMTDRNVALAQHKKKYRHSLSHRKCATCQ